MTRLMASLQCKNAYACTNISIIDKHLIDIWVKFKDTLHYSKTISNFLRVQGQKIVFKDISRTSRTSSNPDSVSPA